jgi:F0F1-type ATP synthase delta subunit
MDSITPAARIDGYASALIDVARAEGDPEVFVDVFYSAAKTISANVELRDTLVDPVIPSIAMSFNIS